VLAVFTSAALVFLLEPMVAKLLLPRLGGSAAVWNTSLVFFQAALLAGYAYAHWLQRLRSLRVQSAVHVAILLGALLFLPLRITGLLGDPSPNAPIPWLLAVLAISVGVPFAALSATAPLLQRWYGLLRLQADGAQAYWLYAASNLGSFVALIAYPALVEPHVSLSIQRVAWSFGFAAFAALVATLALASRLPASRAEPSQQAPLDLAGSWRERIVWILLAAAPSSLMLGVTTYLVTDVASAPFLWVVPLALYLLTFVIAFAKRPPISLSFTLVVQAALVAVTLGVLPYGDDEIALPALFGLNLATFFFTALACHQTLVARRPPQERSTEFFLAIAFGGVLGGAFNALLAPVIFKTVIEYPLVLVLVTLVRPKGTGRPRALDWALLGVVMVLAVAAASLDPALGALSDSAFAWISVHVLGGGDVWNAALVAGRILLGIASVAAFGLRARAWPFAAALALISICATHASSRERWVAGDRGFFGVLRMEQEDDENEGQVRVLYSGTTMHGAEVVDPASPLHCRPMVYYAPATPIGQVVRSLQRRRPSLDLGVVGLGTGSLAAYVRARDTLSYFEIDPKVLGFALDRKRFGYVADCAKGPVRVVLGDARLTISREPARRFDLLVVDAFTSDSVPTHLLTEEAFRGYLRVLKPGGLVLLHLSNRNLELLQPTAATVAAIGAPALQQWYTADEHADYLADSDEQAIVFAQNPAALRNLAHDSRWEHTDPAGAAPWTDDYSDVFGAMVRKFKE
jgi:SAM-dependent methyltransferase